MCHFLSAVLTRDGVLHCRPEVTNSHAELIKAANIRDDAETVYRESYFVKLELRPPRIPFDDDQEIPLDAVSELLDPTTWRFIVDQEVIPEWLDREHARTLMVERAQRMIVNEPRRRLDEGCWVLGPKAVIDEVSGIAQVAVAAGASIRKLEESAFVFEATKCNFEKITGCAIVADARRCEIKVAHGCGAIRMANKCHIHLIRENASILDAFSTKIGTMSGLVDRLGDGSVIEKLWDGIIDRACPDTTIQETIGVCYIANLPETSGLYPGKPCAIGRVQDVLMIGRAYDRPQIGTVEGKVMIGRENYGDQSTVSNEQPQEAFDATKDMPVMSVLDPLKSTIGDNNV